MSQNLTQLEWVHTPQQARSQKTLERLLDAAEALILEKGFAAASVAEVARQANSSVGSFYGRFQDKDALLRCLHERFQQQALATARVALDPARWQGVALATLVAELIEFTAKIFEQRKGLLRTFAVQGAWDENFAARMAAMGEEMALLMVRLFLARREEITHPDPETAARFVFKLVLGMLELDALYGEQQEKAGAISRKSSLAELRSAVLAYLGVPGGTIHGKQ